MNRLAPSFRRLLVPLISTPLAAALGGCSDSQSEQTAVAALTGSADDGTAIVMWSRDDTAATSQPLVDAYNASHENQVELKLIATGSYAEAVSLAASDGTLPDLFSADVVFAPNFTSKGLFLDLTARLEALTYAASLAPAHMQVGTFEGKKYTVPHAVAVSVLFWNKELYSQAGLDPEKGPTTLEELSAQARAVHALGGDISGTTLAGNCGGCGVFTLWPSVWAAGGDVMNADGTAATIDSAQVKAMFAIWRQLFADGIAQPGSEDETGATWVGRFSSGNIGIAPMPSSTLSLMEEAGLQVGVAPIPGPGGGESTFVGGDVLGISHTTEHAAAAWNFLEWTLSDSAQVEILAQRKNLIARGDLTDNRYSTADPRISTSLKVLARGKTPFALNFNQTFNDPQGPWLPTMRGALFGPDLDTALADGNPKLTASLAKK